METLHYAQIKAIKPKELLEMVGTMIQPKNEKLVLLGDGGRYKGGIQLFKVKCLECGNISKKMKASLVRGQGCGCRSGAGGGATRLNRQLVGTKVIEHNRSFEILDYLKKEVVDGKVLLPRYNIRCLDCSRVFQMQVGSFKNGIGCGCRSGAGDGATRLSQQLVGTKVIEHNRNFKILDYLKYEEVDGKTLMSRYSILCLDCDRKFEMQVGNFKQGVGCGCRSGRGGGATRLSQQLVGTKVIEYNRNFEILDYLKKEKVDGKTLMSRYSILCLDCSRIFEMNVSNFNQGFGCGCRTLSRPESLLKTLLDGASINYIHDQSFTWSENKRYDFFLPDMNAIIELHGIQHYEDNSYFQTTAMDQKTNDVYKRVLALTNGIDHYYEVDCRETTDEYIVNSLVNTLPPELIQKLL